MSTDFVDALVGRDAELGLLTEFVEGLLAGRGQATLIEGEPGIGKSSLARATAARAEARGCRVYWAAADELGQILPLRPILEALQNSAARTRLEIIAKLLRGEYGPTVDPTATAAEQMFALIAELCDTNPTVLVVDDLQWADPATTGVWQRLAVSAGRFVRNGSVLAGFHP